MAWYFTVLRKCAVLAGRAQPVAFTERLVWRAFERLSVFPESVAGGRIHRVDDAQRVRDIHPPVVDERCRLTEPGPERDRPDELEPVHVVAVDLVERAVTPSVKRASPVQPVPRIGVEQHGVGDRCERSILGLKRNAGGEVQSERREDPNSDCPRWSVSHGVRGLYVLM